MNNPDKYNVVIKENVIHATVNGEELKMTCEDFDKFTDMVSHAMMSNLHASFIDDANVVHSLNR